MDMGLLLFLTEKCEMENSEKINLGIQLIMTKMVISLGNMLTESGILRNQTNEK